MADRVRTYIEGVDEAMDGGVPKGNVVLLAGGPGTMKSSVAYSILYHNLNEKGTKGLYFMLEQSRTSFVDHLERLGFDPEDTGQDLVVLDLGLLRKNLDIEQTSWIDLFKMYCKNLKDTSKFEILVIDSIDVLSILSAFKEPRKDLFEFLGFLKGMGVTTFLISEVGDADERFAHKGEDFLVDGIIQIRMKRFGDVNFQRQMRVVKMRGTKHDLAYKTLMFSDMMFETTKVVYDQ